MNGLLRQIVEILELESVLTQELLAQAQIVQRHLLRDDVGALLETAHEQETIAQQLAQTEHHRLQLARRAATYLPGLEHRRLAEWIDVLPEPFASHVDAIQKVLRASAVQLQRVNRQNRALVQRSLRYAEMALGVESATYGSPQGRYDHDGDLPQLVDTSI